MKRNHLSKAYTQSRNIFFFFFMCHDLAREPRQGMVKRGEAQALRVLLNNGPKQMI